MEHYDIYHVVAYMIHSDMNLNTYIEFYKTTNCVIMSTYLTLILEYFAYLLPVTHGKIYNFVVHDIYCRVSTILKSHKQYKFITFVGNNWCITVLGIIGEGS